MDRPTFTGAFNNYGHGVQNANINGKSQYNNNSNGTQYNDCTGNETQQKLETMPFLANDNCSQYIRQI